MSGPSDYGLEALPSSMRIKCVSYSSEEWEKHRALITRLYAVDRRSAASVCNALVSDGFYVKSVHALCCVVSQMY